MVVEDGKHIGEVTMFTFLDARSSVQTQGFSRWWRVRWCTNRRRHTPMLCCAVNYCMFICITLSLLLASHVPPVCCISLMVVEESEHVGKVAPTVGADPGVLVMVAGEVVHK